MNLLLQRTSKPGEAKTFGILYDDNQRVICFSLEDPVREVKIKGETAIPAGRYQITLEWSPRFGVDTITLNNVPGFEYIRMHGGNFAGHETFLKRVKKDKSKLQLDTPEYLEVFDDKAYK